MSTMQRFKSDGSTASYYELPEGVKELQQLISHRKMNAQIGEIFRACYRYGMASHSDQLRDAKKILFYAKAEVERLDRLSQHDAAGLPTNYKNVLIENWPEEAEQRIDVIGQNGNSGVHYEGE